MNCDEAFDLITHPTDHNCEELQWHLQLCSRCRQMKETLAPALDTFHQILDDDMVNDDFNEYGTDLHQTQDQKSSDLFPQAGNPFLSTESVRMADQVAMRLRAEAESHQLTKRSAKSKLYQRRLMNAALILFAGILMGWGVSTFVPENHIPIGANNLQKQQPCLWIAQREEKANRTFRAEMDKMSASNVVLSCVACHLSSTTD